MVMLARLPLTDAERANAVRRLLADQNAPGKALRNGPKGGHIDGGGAR